MNSEDAFDKTKARKSYAKEIDESREGGENPEGWRVTRRLDGPMREEQYLTELPLLENKNFVEHIREAIELKRSEGDNSPLVYVDIGFGQGNALLDLRKMFPPDDLIIVGLGHSNYTRGTFRDPKTLKIHYPTEDALKEAGVELWPGNVVDNMVRKVDIITGVYSVGWVAYPKWELLKILYKMLDENGKAFIAGMTIDSSQRKQDSLPDELSDYLKENGYVFNFSGGGIAFKKTKQELPDNITALDRDDGSSGGYVEIIEK